MVVKNDIYSGAPEGFFSYDSFDRFLKGLPGVTESIYDRTHRVRLIGHIISGVPIVALYHFRVDENRKIVDHLDVYSITGTEGLGEIETLILEESKRIN